MGRRYLFLETEVSLLYEQRLAPCDLPELDVKLRFLARHAEDWTEEWYGSSNSWRFSLVLRDVENEVQGQVENHSSSSSNNHRARDCRLHSEHDDVG